MRVGEWLRSCGWREIGVLVAGWLLAIPALAQENLALHRPVVSSGPNWGSFKPADLTDGDPGTFAHPLASTGTLGFYYEVDLGRVVRFERVVLRNRSDGCCTERLSDFRVEVYDAGDDGPGALRWAARVRADGSNSGVGGVDTIEATADQAGVFAGRYLRVVNHNGAAYSPQIAEIEIYGGQPPTITQFTADEDALDPGRSTVLRWVVGNASRVTLATDPGPAPVPVVPTVGSLEVAPASTSTYTLTASNENGEANATLTVGVGVQWLPPELTEFQADNTAGVKDRDGDSPDWIEFYNPNPYGLRLAGYALTDDPGHPAKWVFPEVKLARHGFLVVFASGKDRRTPGEELHTNFRLDADGDYLALIDRDGSTVLRRFPADVAGNVRFDRQVGNSSLGLGMNGLSGHLRPPTPGASNGVAYAGIVSEVTFSRSRGWYEGAFELELGTASAGATIRYTTNRTEPTETRGAIYQGPLSIRSTTVVRAAAFREGWAPSPAATHTYLFPAQVIASSVMRREIVTNATYGPQLPAALRDLPAVSLVTTGTINDTTETAVSVEWMPGSGLGGAAAGVQVDAGVRRYGGAFTDFAKKNFRLYFRSEYGARRLKGALFDGFDHGLAAMDEFDQLELRGGSHDMSQRGFYLGNAFADDTLLDLGHLNPHGRFVHLYLNGTYWGMYHLRERWGAAMHARYRGGSRLDYESINGNWNVGGWAEPGVPYDGDGSTWARIKSLRSDYAAVRAWVDVPQFVDYMLMWMFGGAEDEYRCVGSNVPGCGFQFQLNDADGWFCIPAYCEAHDRTARGAPGRSAGDGPGSLFSMLFQGGNADYRVLLADRIHRALDGEGALTPARGIARLDARSAEMERAFLAEAARWGFLSPAEWRARRDYVRTNWLPRRNGEFRSQLKAAGFAPQLDAPSLDVASNPDGSGKQIRFREPVTGTVWFTTDGSDPRLPGGGVAPTAQRARLGGLTETLVPLGARWKWFTSATGLSSSAIVEGHPAWSMADWKHPGFADGGWSEGPAQLGYGEGDEATVIPFGGVAANKWITAYFRHRFQVARTSDVVRATLRVRRDDGIVVYLNGGEVARSSIVAGAVDGATLGDGASDDGQSLIELAVDPGRLREGANELAAELHQASPASSDASFDLELRVFRRDLGEGVADFPIAGHTIVKCRAEEAGQWSALTETFVPVSGPVLGPGDVVVSELQYHPGSDGTAEFIEIANVSSHAVNLRGARFLEGIDYAFPSDRDELLAPGERRVLVNDLFQFRQRYGMGPAVEGIFAGSLANEGERLTVANAQGEVVLTFRYGETAPWPTEADGTGATLVLSRPELGLDDPAAWRPSVGIGGTPGSSDGVAFTGDPAADEDGDGLSALVEHALGTSDHDVRSGRDAFGVERTEAGWLAVWFLRRLSADDVRLSVEYSADLRTWERANLVAAVSQPDGRRRETWGVPTAGSDGGFLRLNAVR